jgi:hypothetical protein
MFTGKSLALSQAGIDAAVKTLGVGPPEIWTVITVETAGCGFRADRRPQILFERHYFHRLTGGKFDDGDISDPKPGGYGTDQYARLERAIALDRKAALMSASWGLGQVMGENFADVEATVQAMVDSEDAQLAAMSSFMRAQSSMAKALKTHDWPTFAAHYNGPRYAGYDRKLAEAFANHKAPDLEVRAQQLYLTFAGFDPGPVDGIAGPKFRAALKVSRRLKPV